MDKRCLIIVNTIYQLFVVINLKNTYLKDDKVDIILTNNTPSLETIYKKNVLEKIFNKVMFLKKFQKSNKLKLVRIFDKIFRPEEIVKSLKDDLDVYDDYFYFNNNDLFEETLKLLVKRNKNLKLHIFEDGLISYIRKPLSISLKTRLICRFVYHYIIKMKNIDVYIFKPEYKAYKEEMNVKPIKFSDNISFINEVFGYKECNIKEKYIFFEECLEFIEDKEEYYNLIDQIAQTVGYDNFIIKRHPRNVSELSNIKIKILDLDYAWELYCINNDISNKTLITLSSSACTNAAMFFDKNGAKMVMCYKIIKSKIEAMKERYFNDYMYNLKEKSNNFYIPSNREELIDILIN